MTLFAVTICCWARGLCWSVVDLPRETPLGEAIFSFVGVCQLQIASWLGMGSHVFLPLSGLGPCLA